MTKIQIKFLKEINKGAKTASELCKILHIHPDRQDPIGGYYNALNDSINYLTSDDGNEIDDMFRIIPSNNEYSNNDTYEITKSGKKYIESYNRDTYRYLLSILLSIIAIIVTILIAIA